MEGVLMAVLRGKSLARDAGFLGRLVLRAIEGIDGAHASPLTDPDVLTLVIEELEVSVCACVCRGVRRERELEAKR